MISKVVFLSFFSSSFGGSLESFTFDLKLLINYHTMAILVQAPIPRLKRIEIVMARIIKFPKTRLLIVSEIRESAKCRTSKLRYIKVDTPRFIKVMVFSNFDFNGLKNSKNPKTVRLKKKIGIT